MDFFVYDNVMTYNKRNVYNGVPSTRLEVTKIELPENGSFWFYTNMNLIQSNFNIQKRYVHIHPGIGKTNNARFKKTPKRVKRGDIVYNPKEKRIEIKDSILPWKKPIFAKKCICYGSIDKKMSIVGEIFYNFGNDSMHFIIDYFPQKIKFHWEDEPDFEPPTFGQISRVEELEHQIKEVEKKLNA